MIGDLHCHSKLSDGSTSLEDIVFYAKRSGLDFISITDHDTMSGTSRAEILGKRYGIGVIPGMEISCTDSQTGRRAHILCYLPHKPDRIAGLLTRILDDRRRAGREMLRRVMKSYPITEEHVNRYVSASKSIYKVHIMQALLDLGYDTQIYGELYHRLFDPQSPNTCYEPVHYPTVEEALGYVKIARGIAVLAHPSVYRSMELAERLAREGLIQGVEVHHPKNRPEDQARLLELAQTYGLLVTGGTDFHGYYASGSANPLGSCLTDEQNLKKLFELAEDLKGKTDNPYPKGPKALNG